MQDTPAQEADIQTVNTDSGTQPSNQAIDWEKRYKDTQAAYTKARQEALQYKAQVEVLRSQGLSAVQIDDKLKEELEDLKYTNPEEWRRKMNLLENEASSKVSSAIAEKTKELSELEVRSAKLEAFMENHPGFELSDDDIPPRIAKKLASGSISFDEFLEEVYTFVTTPKTIGSSNKTLGQPNLSKAGGSTEPTQNAVYKDVVTSYKTEVY